MQGEPVQNRNKVGTVHGQIAELTEPEGNLVVNPKSLIAMKATKNRKCEFICPVKMSQKELEDFLRHFCPDGRKFLEFLLITNGNEPVLARELLFSDDSSLDISDKFYFYSFERNLANMDIDGKKFRLAMGVGVFSRMIQLWEVRPKTS